MSGTDDRIARSRRRFLIPAVTIAVAAAIFGWSRWTAPQRIAEVRGLVETLLAEASDPAARHRPIDGADPLIAPLVRQAMAHVREVADQRAHAIGIDARVGDASDADGSATHHAVIAIGGQPHATLRVRHAGTAGIRIVGITLEQTGAAP